VRCGLIAKIATASATKQKKAAASPKLAFREAGRQVSPVTISRFLRDSSTPPFLLLFIKGPGGGLEAFAFCLWLLLWALEGFWGFDFCFGLFGVGSFWKGKELVKGKELLKGNC
jgi:hypothetical protein